MRAAQEPNSRSTTPKRVIILRISTQSKLSATKISGYGIWIVAEGLFTKRKRNGNGGGADFGTLVFVGNVQWFGGVGLKLYKLEFSPVHISGKDVTNVFKNAVNVPKLPCYHNNSLQ